MDSTFEYGDFTFRLHGDFALAEDKLVAAAQAAAGAFIDYDGLAKCRVRQIWIEKWDRDYALADVGLWEGWQVICCNPGDERQAVYQLGHELGHIAMGHYKRFGQPDNHQWIDEIVCGACSLHATAYAAEHWLGDVATKARLGEQVQTLRSGEFPAERVRGVPLPVEEFEQLVVTSGFAEKMRPYSGRLIDIVGGPGIVADLPALAEVLSGLTCAGYLGTWQAGCRDGGRTPAGFLEMIG